VKEHIFKACRHVQSEMLKETWKCSAGYVPKTSLSAAGSHRQCTQLEAEENRIKSGVRRSPSQLLPGLPGMSLAPDGSSARVRYPNAMSPASFHRRPVLVSG